MANLNKVMLIGNLTRDPEVRYTPKGTAVTDIGLAVNRVYSTDDGDKREETTFVDITLWGRQAEVAGQYMKKGRPIYVEGRLQLDTWDDKQSGQKRSKLKVIGDNFQFLGSKDDNAGGGGGGGGGYSSAPAQEQSPQQHSAPPQQQQAPPQQSSAPAPTPDPMDDEDDIPF
jgi:single-strand DNA-binding protein